MALAIFKNKLETTIGLDGWRIESAGTWAADGQPASRLAQLVMKKRGLNISGHSSRTINRHMLRSFRLILTMEQGHQEALRAEFPDLAKRVYLLAEFDGNRRDIRDPYGGSEADYEDTAKELEDIIERNFSRLCELAQEG